MKPAEEVVKSAFFALPDDVQEAIIYEFKSRDAEWEDKFAWIHDELLSSNERIEELEIELLDQKPKLKADKTKAEKFVQHIEDHIHKMGITSHNSKVICKICNKDIDQIAEEFEQLFNSEGEK